MLKFHWFFCLQSNIFIPNMFLSTQQTQLRHNLIDLVKFVIENNLIETVRLEVEKVCVTLFCCLIRIVEYCKALNDWMIFWKSFSSSFYQMLINWTHKISVRSSHSSNNLYIYIADWSLHVPGVSKCNEFCRLHSKQITQHCSLFIEVNREDFCIQLEESNHF